MWQLGLQKIPMFHRKELWGYPLFASVGAGVGYWFQDVDAKQTAILDKRKAILLEKRARRAEREAVAAAAEATVSSSSSAA